jgi:predicted flap endonuclease-1-like 5' DNA nuclease
MSTLAMVGIALIITGIAFFMILLLWVLTRGQIEDKPAPKKVKPAQEVEVITAELVAGPEEFVPEVMLPSPGKGQLPVNTIEGIGKAYGEKLTKGGIEYVEDLALTTTEKIMTLVDVSELVAKKWIAMARLTWLDDVSEEDAECIVLGANITSIEELAVAKADDLYNKVSTAEKFGRVRVPTGYKITKAMVQKWIESAKKEMPE